jgi:hypothetical protein
MWAFNFFNKILQISICIRNRICKVYNLINLSKIKQKLQLISFPIKSIPTISFYKNNIITIILWPFTLFSNFNIRLHTFRIKISTFCHITYINFNISNLLIIFQFEIIPICMSFCISIAAYETIILISFNSYS